jgi:hypothetical protein
VRFYGWRLAGEPPSGRVVDVTAAEMLEQLDNELNAAGTRLAFVEMRSRLQDLTLRYGLLETRPSAMKT